MTSTVGGIDARIDGYGLLSVVSALSVARIDVRDRAKYGAVDSEPGSHWEPAWEPWEPMGTHDGGWEPVQN